MPAGKGLPTLNMVGAVRANNRPRPLRTMPCSKCPVSRNLNALNFKTIDSPFFHEGKLSVIWRVTAIGGRIATVSANKERMKTLLWPPPPQRSSPQGDSWYGLLLTEIPFLTETRLCHLIYRNIRICVTESRISTQIFISEISVRQVWNIGHQ